MNAEQALNRLRSGNANFVADKLDGMLQDSNRRKELTSSQEPFAIILSCADSRVVPELAFDAGLGELFVIRVAGNVVDTTEMASIEYAVAILGTQLIMVMGHEECGAVGAAMDNNNASPSIAGLVKLIKPAIDACPGGEKNDIVRKNAQLTAQRMIDESEIIRNATQREENPLKIVSAYYHFESGRVEEL